MSTYVIGLPPRNIPGMDNWLSVNKTFLRATIIPKKCSTENLVAALSATSGETSIRFEEAGKEFCERAVALGATFTEQYDKVLLNCMLEGTISDSYRNELDAGTLTAKLGDLLSNNQFGSWMRAIHTEYGRNIFKALAKQTKDKDAVAFADSLDEQFKNPTPAQTLGKEVANLLDTNVPEGGLIESLLKNTDSLISTLVGNRPVYPKIWSNSDFSSTYSFKVRLYNPNPASERMHISCIVNPLCALQALCLPVALDDNHYDSPLYIGIKVPGLFGVDEAIIDSMNVIKGGDDQAIAFNGRPSYIDVNLTCAPIFNKRLIQNNVGNTLSEAQNIKYLKQSYDTGEEIGSGNGASSNNKSNTGMTEEQIASTNISDTAPSRNNPIESAMAEECKSETGISQSTIDWSKVQIKEEASSTSSYMDKAKSMFSNGMDACKSAYASAKEYAGEKLEKTGQFLSECKDAAGEKISNLIDSLQEKDIKDVANDFQISATDWANGLTDNIAAGTATLDLYSLDQISTVKQGEGTISSFIDKTKEKLSSCSDTVSEYAKKIPGMSTEDLSEKVDEYSAAMKEGWSTVTEKTSEYKEKVMEYTSVAKDKAVEYKDKAVDCLKETYDNLTSEESKEKAAEVLSTCKDKFSSGVGYVKDTFSEYMPEVGSFDSLSIGSFDEFTDKAGKSVSGVKDKLADYFNL